MKDKLLTILAQAWSILLYPLWMPTVGMVLYCYGYSHVVLPLQPMYTWIGIGTTFFMTAFIPLTIIVVGVSRGQINDVYIKEASQRTLPYLYSLICYAVWSYFLWHVMHVAPFFLAAAIGATVCLGMVTAINLKWKISSHLSGLGGLIGGILAFYCFYHMVPSFTLIGGLLLIALLLMYARLYLNAHDELQVVSGFLLGLCSTFLPSLLVC